MNQHEDTENPANEQAGNRFKVPENEADANDPRNAVKEAKERGIEPIDALNTLSINDGPLSEMNGAEAKEMIKEIYDVGDDALVRKVDADDEKKKEPFSNKLIRLIKSRYQLFRDSDDNPFALPNDGHHAIPLEGKEFRNELTKVAFSEFNKVPNGDQLGETRRLLSAEAMADQREVHTRFAVDDDVVFVDRCDEAGKVYKVASEAITYTKEPPIFLRPKGIHPLPEPNYPGNIEPLRDFINTRSEGEFWLSVAWLLTVHRPDLQCPILILQGEQGSGKTTVSRMMRELCDPRSAPIASQPRSPEDAFVNAKNWRVLAYDNLSGISRQLADALCGIATGTGWTGRELYTTNDESSFTVQRAIMANGIDSLATRGDIQDRSIIMQLPSIAKGQRKSEDELWRNFADASPRIYGAILEAIQHGINNPVKLDNPPRMAGFAHWAASCLQFFNITPDQFNEYIDENRRGAIEAVLEEDPAAQALLTIAEDGDAWEGTASELAEKIKELSDAPTKELPNTRQVKNRLKRLAPALRSQGLEWNFKKGSRGVRLITLWSRSNHKDDKNQCPF